MDKVHACARGHTRDHHAGGARGFIEIKSRDSDLERVGNARLKKAMAVAERGAEVLNSLSLKQQLDLEG